MKSDQYCQCENSKTANPCIVCGKPKFIDREWLKRKIEEDGDEGEIGAGFEIFPSTTQPTATTTGVSEELRHLTERTENFWAFLQGEYGVHLSSEDREDRNVDGFFAALEDAHCVLGAMRWADADKERRHIEKLAQDAGVADGNRITELEGMLAEAEQREATTTGVSEASRFHFCDETPIRVKDADGKWHHIGAGWLAITEAEYAALSTAPSGDGVPFTDDERRRFSEGGCFVCGYNGRDYYQPSVHPCAARFHASTAGKE